MIDPYTRQFIDSFSARIRNPRGECCDAAISLGILLAARGYHTRLVKGKWKNRIHWWLICDRTIIDPTAHQFNVNSEYVLEFNPEYILEEIHRINFDSIAGYLDDNLVLEL